MTTHAENPSPPEGESEAAVDLRRAGYCVLCDALVEQADDGRCPAGHPAEAITGGLTLLGEEPLPVLPRFNLAAFFLPPVWGPAHGQWVGALFLPIWLFADSAVSSAARRGGLMWIAAAVVAAGTLGFQFAFARRGNGLAFRRVIGRRTVAEFVARQRVWAWVCVPLSIALLGWGIWFDVAVAPFIKR